MFSLYLILADAASNFLDTSLGKILSAIATVFGVLVLAGAVFKAIKDFLGGKVPAGVKTVVGGLFVATLLLDLKIPLKATTVMSTLVGDAISTFSSTAKTAGDTGSAGSTDVKPAAG